MPGVATRKTRLHGRKPSAAWLHATSLQKMVGRDANDHAQAEKRVQHRAPFAKGGSTKMLREQAARVRDFDYVTK